MNFDLEKIRECVENTSGFPFELEISKRIERYPRGAYWVQPNYSFEDQDSGEARELDFHAVNAIPVSTRSNEYIFATILGSCKKNTNPYLFFTRQLPIPELIDCDLPISGFPMEIFHGKERESLNSYLRLEDCFHNMNINLISSQLCELQMKDRIWQVKDTQILKNTIVPLIKVMASEMEGSNSSEPSENNLSYDVYYPLLVLKGDMLQYYVPTKGKAIVKPIRHLTFVKHHQSKSVKCQYAIDIIHESYLSKYLDLIDHEIFDFAIRINQNKKTIKRSIQKLYELKKIPVN